jgi:amidase
MRRNTRTRIIAGAAAVAVVTTVTPVFAKPKNFEPWEASIDDIRRAITVRKVPCVDVVQGFLDRIAAYNPVFNAVIETNQSALAQAAALDAMLARTGRPVGPLHCVPMAVKDAIDSQEMPSSAGSVPLDAPAPNDATVVARLRAAGAIIIAKSNLDEFGRGSSGLSTKGGQTRNAWDLERIPGGSSGGSGVAVATSMVPAALAEETGVSIRNPCANAGIACIAPTQGLVSRDGVAPISFTQDRIGQYGKSVKDAAIVLDAIAGYDPADPVTAASVGRMPTVGYAAYATGSPKSLRGARLGVVREHMTVFAPADAESVAVAEAALAALRAQGAILVDSLPMDTVTGQLLPVLDPLFYPSTNWNFVCDSDTTVAGNCPNPGWMRMITDARTNNFEFRFAMNRYLKERALPGVPDVTRLISTGPFFSTTFRNGLVSDNGVLTLNSATYAERLLRRKAVQEITLKIMADFKLDALVFPMKTVPAPKIGAPGEPTVGFRASGGNILSPISGFPSVLVPIGFTQTAIDRNGDGSTTVNAAKLPVNLEFVGRPFTEPELIRLASAFEAATRARGTTPLAPPL